MELRIQRFRHIHDVSVLSEKALGFLRLKHLLYIGFGVLILWRAMVLRDAGAFAFSLLIFAFGVASAILSRGSCSFEARVVLTMISIVDTLLTPKESSKTKPAQAKPKAKPKPREKTPRKPESKPSTTSTGTSISGIFRGLFGKAVKSKTVNIVVASTGLAMFALSTLTLFGYTTPLAVLGVYSLLALAGASASIGFIGLFMLLSSVLGNPFRGVRR